MLTGDVFGITIGAAVLTFVGGIVGGVLSSVAGGASIISYPILLGCGVPPVAANVTNHMAKVFDYIGAISASLKELKGNWLFACLLSIFTVIGSVIGTRLLLIFPESVFEDVVPVLLIFSGAMFLWRNYKAGQDAKKVQIAGGTAMASKLTAKSKNKKQSRFFAVIVMLLIGCYIGYFGGASGVLLLVAMDYLSDRAFLVNNAIKNLIAGFSNLIAFIVYALSTHVYWTLGVILAVGMFIGGYIGPTLMRHISVKLLRYIVAVLSFALAAYFIIYY